ncbi:MAG: hypothetical protein ACUVTW_02500 [Thermogutta sp.]
MRDSTFSDRDREFFSDSRLGRRLRQEAAEDRPTFSPSLHARIMAAVESEPPSQINSRPRLPHSRRAERAWNPFTIATGMVAATLLIGLVLWRFAADHRRPDEAPAAGGGERQVAQDRTAPGSDFTLSPPEVLETASSLPDIAIRQLQLTLVQAQDRQWAYLDHDAAVARRLVESQFPTGLAAADTP